MSAAATDPANEKVTLSVDAVRALVTAAVKGLDVADEDKAVATEHFVAAEERDRGGVDRLNQLARTLERFGEGERTPITVLRESASTALLDGGGHLGYAVAESATQTAIAKAKAGGIAVVAANNHRYSGVLGHYVELAARDGLVAMAISGGNLPVMAPFGGREAALCTNPIAFGFPTTEGPIVWDAASSAISGHLLALAEQFGQLLPAGVAVDAEGAPTSDPSAARAGALLPWGGHRGGGLAVSIQLLGLLTGIDADLRGPEDWEAAFVIVAIDPSRFLPPGTFEQAAAEFAAGIRATPPAPGHERVRMPSDRSLGSLEDRRRRGLELDPTELAELRRLAEHGAS